MQCPISARQMFPFNDPITDIPHFIALFFIALTDVAFF